MFQTITLYSKYHKMTMVGQPVKNSAGDHVIKENSIPFAEF